MFTIAMHHGWWRAAAVVAGAVVMAAEVTITRSGATEIFRAALFGAALAGREVVTLAFGGTRGAKTSRLWHAAFPAPLRRQALAMILMPTMHHGGRAFTVIRAATEGLATVMFSTLHLIVTEGRAGTFTGAIVTTPVAIAGAAMTLWMIALAVIIGMGAAFGLATTVFRTALGAAAIGLTPVGFTTLRLRAFAFGIGA